MQTFVKNKQKQFCPVVLILWVTLNWKLSLLLRSEIPEPFVNTLTADDTYSCYKREKLSQAIQMQLSKKQKKMYELFISFLESILNFGRFLKRDEDHCSFISDITDSQRCCYLNAFIAMF